MDSEAARSEGAGQASPEEEAAEFEPTALPPFRFPLSYAPKFVPALLLGRRRSLGADAEWLLGRTGRQPVVRGEEHIPLEGPFVAVVNHHQRRFYWVGWNALLVSMVVRRQRPDCEVHWVMRDGFERRRAGAIPWPWWFLRWLFRRVARMFGMVPVPTDPSDKARGAAAVRAMFGLVSLRRGSSAGEPLGLFPEARNQPGRILGRPPPAAGRLLLDLAGRGVPVLPVGVHEVGGELTISFGPPFSLERSPGEAQGEAAEDACRRVMVAIGRLLPRELWGAYEAEIASGQT